MRLVDQRAYCWPFEICHFTIPTKRLMLGSKVEKVNSSLIQHSMRTRTHIIRVVASAKKKRDLESQDIPLISLLVVQIKSHGSAVFVVGCPWLHFLPTSSNNNDTRGQLSASRSTVFVESFL